MMRLRGQTISNIRFPSEYKNIYRIGNANLKSMAQKGIVSADFGKGHLVVSLVIKFIHAAGNNQIGKIVKLNFVKLADSFQSG